MVIIIFMQQRIFATYQFIVQRLVVWEFVGTAFTEQTRPNFEPQGNIWAPDINRIGNKYVLYYSMSEWGGEWTCGIGCAVSDRPDGPFKDNGMMFRSNGIKYRIL